ncbi:thiamine monophosphate kinase [Hydrogenophaga sp. Root209]|uniref:thiamine-phosphate kinase n=1 Tax=unclassified Hydrogenophaga TaxID=2610897 RepID=UPI0006F6F1A6|nr:thiamine-phosphate kinase [Hydrogenophaga sp. Root209]KRC11927.1 thiamine monophosphate kinase [Hydrogenophaga sp. Root209]
MGEFELIRRHFQREGHAAPTPVVLGIGDDCALLQPRPGHLLAVSTDMLVEGRHFFAGVDPEALGHKALAVNLSDLAAMGAHPLGFTLALALPEAQEDWLTAFARGLFALADQHACPLVGGDTTRGPLNICITVMGEVRPGMAMQRSQAQVDDDLYLTGRTGEARLALELMRGTDWATSACGPQSLSLHPELRQRLERPTPRVALGALLAALGSAVHAAIDVSDGLVGDLGHILQASGVGAEIALPDLPVAPALLPLTPARRLDCILNGGDDYELLFTAAPTARAAVEAAAQASHTPVQRIGRIGAAPGLRVLDASGHPVVVSTRSFDHFA